MGVFNTLAKSKGHKHAGLQRLALAQLLPAIRRTLLGLASLMLILALFIAILLVLGLPG